MDYWTIDKPGKGFYEAKGSKFYGHAAFVNNEKQVVELLNHLRDQYSKAHHICYAYRIGLRQTTIKTHDDGEPANTAGKPILHHIQGWDLANVIVAIARYFGGVKLGKGGLISAYGTAAKAAISDSGVHQQTEVAQLQVEVDYATYPIILDKLKQQNIPIVDNKYLSDKCRLAVSIPEAETAYWQSWLLKWQI